MGIPVSQFELVNDQKFRVTVAEKEQASLSDLLLYADSFHIAKFLIKHEAYSHGFDVGFVPTDGQGGSNDLSMEIGNLKIENSYG